MKKFRIIRIDHISQMNDFYWQGANLNKNSRVINITPILDPKHDKIICLSVAIEDNLI